MASDSIGIGVLFSQTGKMAVTETAHINGVLLACDEINAAGGILGKRLGPILMNPDGDDRKYAEMTTDLILNYGVKTIFGCCLSTSRKAVLPIIERFDGLLFYPSVYEGFEYSPNVIYGGAVPNQIVPPLLEYLFQHHGKSIALIGSDTLYAREINRVVKEFLVESGGDVVSETYLPFNATEAEVLSAIDRNAASETDAVLSTVVGESSVALYDLYSDSKLRRNGVPISSLTTTESELKKVSKGARAGHLSVAAYFASIDTIRNQGFLRAFAKKFGNDEPLSIYSEVGYSLVNFYANAVGSVKSEDTIQLLQALSGSVFKAPSGDLSIDVETNHFNLRPHIGRSLDDGTFEIVWDGPRVTAPDPYLVSYDRLIEARAAV